MEVGQVQVSVHCVTVGFAREDLQRRLACCILQLQLLQTSIKYEKRALPTSARQLRPSNACGDSMACSMAHLALSRAHPCCPRRQPSRARADSPTLLHLLLTVIGRHACFLGFAPPQLFMALLMSLLTNSRTEHHALRAAIEFCSVSMSRTRCGAAKPHACRWNSMRRACTLCMQMMGVARADGLYGHG